LSERIPSGGPFKASIGLHEPLSIEHLREARRLLASYCSEPSRFCEKYIEVVGEIARLVGAVRLEDLMDRSDYTGVDSGVIQLLRKLMEAYSKYIAGFLLTLEDRIAVKALKSVEVGGIRLEEGEVALLPPSEAFPLYLAGEVELIESNLIRLHRRPASKG